MTRDDAIAAIGEVIQQVQGASGYESPDITAELCPLRDLKGFDSMIGVVATGFVAAMVGHEIPSDVNLFVDNNRPLTVAEAADRLCATVGRTDAET